MRKQPYSAYLIITCINSNITLRKTTSVEQFQKFGIFLITESYGVIVVCLVDCEIWNLSCLEPKVNSKYKSEVQYCATR